MNSLPDACAPEIAELYNYWQSIHPKEGLPGRQHFDPLDVWKLSPKIWMLDVMHDPLTLTVRRAGMEIVDFTGREVTGLDMADLFPDIKSSDAWPSIAKAAETGVIYFRRAKIMSNPEKDFIESERLYLPLAANGRDVDMFLNITVYLKFR